MKNHVLILLALFICFSAQSQDQASKEKFMKKVYSDFKKNRMDKLGQYFVDSVFLEQMITEIFEKEKKLPAAITREKIHKERASAKKRFLKSLQKAYDQFEAENATDLKRNTPEMEIYGARTKPIESFGFKYNLMLGESAAELKIPEVVYNSKRKRYVFLSDRVRAYITPANARIEEVEIATDRASEEVETAVEAVAETVEIEREVVEMEREVVEEDVVMDVPPPPPPAPDLKDPNTVFQYAEKLPQFPGGKKAMEEWLANNTLYPSQAASANLQGKVYVRFVVNKDGTISKAQILRGLGLGTEKEAMRLVKKMPNWEPGVQNGQTVQVEYTLAIPFGTN